MRRMANLDFKKWFAAWTGVVLTMLHDSFETHKLNFHDFQGQKWNYERQRMK